MAELLHAKTLIEKNVYVALSFLKYSLHNSWRDQSNQSTTDAMRILYFVFRCRPPVGYFSYFCLDFLDDNKVKVVTMRLNQCKNL